MSKAKVFLLTIGLVAVIAVAFVGANSYVSSTRTADQAGAACETKAETHTASATSSGACPSSSALTASADKKDCPMSASCPSSARCSKTCGAKTAKTAAIESIDAQEGESYTLTGRYVCGACDLGVGKECQPAFKTVDGKNYLLSKNNLSQKLREDARDKNVEIVTRVKKYDGVKYLEVEAVRTAS